MSETAPTRSTFIRGIAMNDCSTLRRAFVVVLALTPIAGPARAEEAAGPTRAEFAKLQNEVKEQRSLLIQLMQSDQQRYDMLLRLMQGQPGVAPAPSPPAAEEAPSGGSSGGTAAPKRSRPEPERRAAVDGKVSLPGGDLGEVYVYVDGLRGAPARGKSIEIKQEGRQFSPRLAVVQAGTTAVFPNFDSVFHNVFSSSPHNSFDLGTYRAGDKPRSVTLTSPGVVDVFCNMHQKMSASILVLPNSMYAKVRPDGTFRIDNVPVGSRKIVAWSPHSKVAQQRIEVSPQGGQASFTLEATEGHAHPNKLGQAYGSYRD
jgi:plastocyanin